MIEQQNLVNSLYTTLNSLIGDQATVYEGEAAQDANLPVCVFTIVGDTPEEWMVRDSLDVSFQVSLYGWKKDGIKAIREISDTLFIGLHRRTFEVVGYNYIICFGTVRGIVTIADEIIEIRTEYKVLGAQDPNAS